MVLGGLGGDMEAGLRSLAEGSHISSEGVQLWHDSLRRVVQRRKADIERLQAAIVDCDARVDAEVGLLLLLLLMMMTSSHSLSLSLFQMHKNLDTLLRHCSELCPERHSRGDAANNNDDDDDDDKSADRQCREAINEASQAAEFKRTLRVSLMHHYWKEDAFYLALIGLHLAAIVAEIEQAKLAMKS